MLINAQDAVLRASSASAPLAATIQACMCLETFPPTSDLLMLFSRDDLFRSISNSLHHPVVFRVRQALLATESLGFEVCRLLDSPIPRLGSSTMPTHLILLLQLAPIIPTLLLDFPK